MNPCPCGRYHAPWWGRFVKAPSCTLSDQEIAADRFFGWSKRRRNR